MFLASENIDFTGLSHVFLLGGKSSLQIFYELVTLLDVSVDQFFFPNKETDKSTQRRQLETLLDSMDNKDLTVITATAKAIQEVKNETAGE